MLVLVLILVAIALVLLVLTLLFLHMVLLAWVSVGLCLLAGLALAYDWWQDRAAVRAGRSAVARGADDDLAMPAAVPSGAERTTMVGGSERTTAVGAAEGGTTRIPGEGFSGADMEPATQVLPVVPPPASASEETVVLPVVQPSGSTEAPSGASRSSGVQSRSVTGSGARAADRDPLDDTSGVADAGPVGAVDATSVVAGADPGGGPVSGNGTGVPPSGARDGRTGTAPGSTGRGAGPAAQAGSVAAGTGAAVGGQSAGTTGDRYGGTDGDAPTSVAGAVGAPGQDAEDPTRAAAPVDPSDEAPEEPRDPTLAALVSRLPDEVVVIDEHPRYHVQSCPLLPGQPVIPLPVSEAVELGFTPCGLCSPNRTLGERNPAEAR